MPSRDCCYATKPWVANATVKRDALLGKLTSTRVTEIGMNGNLKHTHTHPLSIDRHQRDVMHQREDELAQCRCTTL